MPGQTTLYGLSSQARSWSFESPKALLTAREAATTESADKVKESQALELRLLAKASIANANAQNVNDTNPPTAEIDSKRIDMLTAEEQLAFTRYWESKIINYCTVFRLDRVIQVCRTSPVHF